MTTAAHKTFLAEDIEALKPTMKVGLLATVNDEGLPHLTLISSLQANNPRQVIWGQFTEGLSKRFIRQNPKAGFLVMTLDKNMWRGKATFTHTARQGAEFEMYNNTPMFRYNAYFGIHTVYFMDLVEQTGRQPLPMGPIVMAAIQTMVARGLGGRRGAKAAPTRVATEGEVLNPWTRGLLNKLDNLKFVGYVGTDGYPIIIPAIQAQAAGPDRVLFSAGVYREELEAMPPGDAVAVFAMSLEMEDVLLRGEYEGIRRLGGVPCGSVLLNWVYSPMPPKPEQIYPPVALEAVTAF